MNKATLNLI